MAARDPFEDPVPGDMFRSRNGKAPRVPRSEDHALLEAAFAGRKRDAGSRRQGS